MRFFKKSLLKLFKYFRSKFHIYNAIYNHLRLHLLLQHSPEILFEISNSKAARILSAFSFGIFFKSGVPLMNTFTFNGFSFTSISCIFLLLRFFFYFSAVKMSEHLLPARFPTNFRLFPYPNLTSFCVSSFSPSFFGLTAYQKKPAP